MNNEINISESEWTVMEYLWNNPMVTITEIRKALSSTGWSDSTIKTLVRRLVSKNAVAINDEAATFRYYPLISQQECRLKETKSFINRVYDGSVSMRRVVIESYCNAKPALCYVQLAYSYHRLFNDHCTFYHSF